MNRAQRREIAQRAVKRGGASGYVTREARRLFAVGLKDTPQSVEDKARELGLEVSKPKLWTPRGLLKRARDAFR